MRHVDFTTLFCTIDDFCQEFQAQWEKQLLIESERKIQRASRLCLSEVITILVGFQLSGVQCFKWYYQHLLFCRRSEFPNLVSYTRFVELTPGALIPMIAYLNSRTGEVTGISCVDSTSIAVCKNKRIQRNKVFSGIAKRGKTSMGWFFGFKLHLIVNERGDLLSFKLTPGNVGDRGPLEKLSKDLFGKLFGDKGYLGKRIFKKLFKRGVKLVTGIRANMKNQLLEVQEKLLLKKRFIIETIIDQLKCALCLEHSRHRSPLNFLVNLLGGLIAYTHQEKKPRIKWSSDGLPRLVFA